MILRGMSRKAAIFAVLTLLLLVGGAYCALSVSASVDPGSLEVQNSIDVFVSDPKATVNVSASVANRAFDVIPETHPRLGLKLEISSAQPTNQLHWVVRIQGNSAIDPASPPRHYAFVKEDRLFTDAPNLLGSARGVLLVYGTADELSLPLPQYSGMANDPIAQNSKGIVASIDIPQFDISNDAGYAAKLPRLDYGWAENDFPAYAVERDDDSGLPVHAVAGPSAARAPSQSAQLDFDHLRYPNATPVPFFEAVHQDASIYLAFEAGRLSDSQSLSVVPPDASVSDDNLLWKSSDAALAASVATARIGYADKKSTRLFLAGLLIGASFSAGVAAVQEFRSTSSSSVPAARTRGRARR